MAWTANRTWVSGETLTAALLNQFLRDNLDAAFPVGSLHWRMQAATTSQTTIGGMLLECNAVSVLRADFAALNTTLSGLSYPFGTVDGTHMTLPDLQGRGPQMMSSGGHGDVNALGDSDGVTKASRTPKATIAGASAHTHSETAHTHSETAHTHGAGSLVAILPAGTQAGASAGAVNAQTITVTGSTASGGGGTTGSGGGGTTGSGGGGGGGTVSGAFLVVGVIGVKY